VNVACLTCSFLIDSKPDHKQLYV